MSRRLAKLMAGAAVAALVLVSGGAAGAVPAAPQGVAPVDPLVVTDVRPDGGTTGFPVATSIFVDFDGATDFQTLTENVSVKKVGARKAISTSVAYLPPSSVSGPLAILNPTNDLRPNTRYGVTLFGGRDGVRAEDGGRLSGVDDPTARFRDKRVIWSFTTADGA